MIFNRQWYWGGSLVLLLTIVLLVVVQTSADDAPAEPVVPEQPYNSLELAKMTAKQRAHVIERMSLAENLFVRGFDIVASNGRRRFWLDAKGMRTLAQQLMDGFGIKTASINSRIESLYGGNVHRAVLARELTGEVDLLVISNRYCALDFAAVREIRRRIVASPNAGAAVLLMSEDLDELLEIAGRIVVLSARATAYETPVADAEIGYIGRHMAGHA